jgi:3-oxoacyl-[acyl-carrier-protein] synthase II
MNRVFEVHTPRGATNRVVVTGLGVTSPVGSGKETFWRNLLAGRSGIGPITLFDASALPVRIGGEVRDMDTASLFRHFPEAAEERDRKISFGLAAMDEAIRDAGLDERDLWTASLHVGVGLEMFCLDDITPYAGATDIAKALAEAALKNGDGWLLQTPLDRIADILGRHFGLRGGRWINCSACAAGAQVIGDAFHLLREGDGEVALVGATDSMLNPLGLAGFGLLRVLSTENDTPERACRPFDAGRKGTVLGEGAGALVLETLDHAERRAANVYAELLGYGASMDAYRVSDPEPGGNGARLSMTAALADARLEPAQVDCVNAHGTGTPKNDVVETAAIKEVLGSRSREVPVHAVKSMTGHMIAASGAVEGVTAVLTVQRRAVPPTINLRCPDPECDLDYVGEGAREFTGETVLSNSFGFGGQNATLIFGRFA